MALLSFDDFVLHYYSRDKPWPAWELTVMGWVLYDYILRSLVIRQTYGENDRRSALKQQSFSSMYIGKADEDINYYDIGKVRKIDFGYYKVGELIRAPDGEEWVLVHWLPCYLWVHTCDKECPKKNRAHKPHAPSHKVRKLLYEFQDDDDIARLEGITINSSVEALEKVKVLKEIRKKCDKDRDLEDDPKIIERTDVVYKWWWSPSHIPVKLLKKNVQLAPLMALARDELRTANLLATQAEETSSVVTPAMNEQIEKFNV